MIAAAKAHGSLVIGQATHGGRQVSEDVNKVSWIPALCVFSTQTPLTECWGLAEPGFVLGRSEPAARGHDFRQAASSDCR